MSISNKLKFLQDFIPSQQMCVGKAVWKLETIIGLSVIVQPRGKAGVSSSRHLPHISLLPTFSGLKSKECASE